ncbi:MAG TPA: sigma-70 family RNA polymerase sigma factor [Actinomycetota bacterium]|nr:sigma-70 family RNA polymerase sigma factor [Actinomycetota bacterium]
MGSTRTTTEFTAFYEATKDAVFRAVLLARGGEAEGAEDAVAEAYERALLRWEKLRAHDNPTGWVIRTAINHRISMWRRHGRRGAGTPPTASLPIESIDPALLRIVRELPRGQREVLALRVLLDFSVDQTADALGIRPGTVKAQLHRALAALRAELATRQPEEVWQ